MAYGNIRRISLWPRILALLLLISVISLAGTIWFDFLGIINAKQILSPLYQLAGGQAQSVIEEPDDILLLDKERLLKEQQRIEQLSEQLASKEAQLDTQEQELAAIKQKLEEEEKDLEARRNALTEETERADSKKAKLEQNADYLLNMPPQSAVDIMLQMDDLEMIEHLETAERLIAQQGGQSIVPYWLSLMPADRVAIVKRKMVKRAEIQ